MINIDQKRIEDVKELLKNGQATEFWKLICEAIDDSIDQLQREQDGDDLKDIPAEQYKLEVELSKAKRKYLNHLKNLPEGIIAYITQPAANSEEGENPDPYYSPEELAKEELSQSKE